MNENKFVTKLKQSRAEKVTYMCTQCFKLFEVSISKLNIKLEMNAESAEEVSISPSFYGVNARNAAELFKLSHNCSRTYEKSVDQDERVTLVQIDNDLAPAIQKFNQLGMTTSFCCQGHVMGSGNASSPYIVFTDMSGKKPKVWKEVIEELVKDMILVENVKFRNVIDSLALDAMSHLEYEFNEKAPQRLIIRFGDCKVFDDYMSNPTEENKIRLERAFSGFDDAMHRIADEIEARTNMEYDEEENENED